MADVKAVVQFLAKVGMPITSNHIQKEGKQKLKTDKPYVHNAT